MNIEELIGRTVKYYDYLGFERFGRIILFEPIQGNNEELYVYIEDEESEYNVHDIIINGEMKMYAEIRVSSEVYIDERKG